MTASRSARRRSRSSAFRLAICGALALAGAIGGGAGTGCAHALRHGRPGEPAARGDPDQAIVLGEAAVAKAPQNAALLAALGQAYLRAGRFEAAAHVLGAAAALGDAGGDTTLGLALAEIAGGQHRAGLAALDRGAATIAPARLGLALALAGDAERGIALLADRLRDGPADPTLRQNLAYAYALAGRWADAALTAAFDLPPDQVAARLQQWAEVMQSGGERLRIARLLNVPLVADPGLPPSLAWNDAQTEPAPTAERAAPATDETGGSPTRAAAADSGDPHAALEQADDAALHR